MSIAPSSQCNQRKRSDSSRLGCKVNIPSKVCNFTRNILLKSDGSAAVSDFGLARVKSSDDVSKTTSDVGPLRW